MNTKKQNSEASQSPGTIAVATLWPDLTPNDRTPTAWGHKTPAGLAASIDNLAADYHGMDRDIYSSLKPGALQNLIEDRATLLATLKAAIGCIGASLDEVPSETRASMENDLARYREALQRATVQA